MRLLMLACLLLASCGPKPIPPKVIIERIVETVEVITPQFVARVPPPELMAPLHPERPVFISPESPDASSALSAEGERVFRVLIVLYQEQIEAWKAWAATPPEEK